MKTLLLTIAFVLFSTPVFAQVVPFDGTPTLATYSKENVQSVDLLLRSIHELPPKASFESVKDGRDIVVAIALAGDSLQRDRALVALAKYWPSGDVYLLLAKTIADTGTRKATKIRAMISLGETFRGRALPVLNHYLASNDVSIQIAAIRAIGLGSTKEGFDRLATLRLETKSSVIKDAIDRYGMRIAD